MGLPKNYKCGYQILDLSTYTNGSKLTQEDFDEIVKKLNEYSLINKQILVVLKDFAFVLDTFKVFNALVSMGSRYIYIYKNNVDVVNIDNGSLILNVQNPYTNSVEKMTEKTKFYFSFNDSDSNEMCAFVEVPTYAISAFINNQSFEDIKNNFEDDDIPLSIIKFEKVIIYSGDVLTTYWIQRVVWGQDLVLYYFDADSSSSQISISDLQQSITIFEIQ